MIASAYLAPEGLEDTLAEELARRGVRVSAWHGRLALSPQPPVASAWALDVWTAPREIEIASVKSAADALRALQRNWSAYPVLHHRRMALIAERLPPVKGRPLQFPQAAPASHLGAWTLLAPDRMLASPTKSSPFVNGECLFLEDHFNPPSRAYLKLWEACTRLGAWPQPGDECLDLGASPGGWTWAIADLGATVTAIDKADLHPRVAAMPGVTLRRESAFALPPERVDWLFSDIIAYPDRLLALVKAWIAAAAPGRIVCTVKFQGATDHEAAEAFAAIEGGQLMHLYHNKHELTFVWRKPEAP
jgi:23S rRNA (cytidine2498-2'-O)-methyltransferase